MKKFLFLVIALCAFIGFNSNVRAAESVQSIPVCPEGFICTTVPGTFQFTYPTTNQVWYAGQAYAVGFISSNFNGYVNLQLVNANNPDYNRYGISSLSVYENGLRTEYFILPRYVSPGKYKVVASVHDYNTDQFLSVTSSVVITVANSIISPAHGDLVRVSKKFLVKLASRVPIGEIAVVYLQGKGLGQQYDHLALGVIHGGWDRLKATMPATLPNREPLLNGSDYQIVVKDWSTWLYGDTFRGFNPKLNLPIPPPSLENNDYGGGIVGKN